MDKGLTSNNTSLKKRDISNSFDSLVLDKDIFSNIFEKDIRRIYIYKKAERIAKAVHLIAPALRDSRPLRERLERIAIALIDASVLSPTSAREAIGKELLSLSSVLSLAKSTGYLSSMNAEIIMREAHNLLQEVAGYEDPRLVLEETPTLVALAKSAPKELPNLAKTETGNHTGERLTEIKDSKGQVKDTNRQKDRREEIITVLSSKGPMNTKEISLLVRNVSEKTIQRELQALVSMGRVSKEGERRWTRYSLVR